MLSEQDIGSIATESGVNISQTRQVVVLLSEGMTVPFIARYRKEKTGNLDETGIEKVQEWLKYTLELTERRVTILKTIDQQGKLTPELAEKINNTYKKTELEDLYLPFKPKRRTRATIAREKGLGPLAEIILDSTKPGLPDEFALAFISKEKGVADRSEALNGAADIVAEIFSENPQLRKKLRQEMATKGLIQVSVTKEWLEKRSKFEQYYDYQEAVKTIPSHRWLAIRRGQNEKVLRSAIHLDPIKLVAAYSSMLFAGGHPRQAFLRKVMADALKRLLLPSIETDIMAELKIKADEEAIGVFAANLDKLLLTPPAGSKKTLGIDPGFRTGCKCVVLDETGNLLKYTTIFPNKPQEAIADAKKIVLDLISRYQVEAVVIGNGTASRETIRFFKEVAPPSVVVTMVNEAGASVYSASLAGREEFPEQDVTVRGAVSIGRRFQDPLAELVKIDPKSIGVGQYQHDVNQTRLKEKLDNVVSSVVNRVGVDLNRSSKYILKYVSGIGESLAQNIVDYRQQNGLFTSRRQLTGVTKFGAKAFQLSAGFLRIMDGENPLDQTGIHPESYPVVNHMCKNKNLDVSQLIRNKNVLQDIQLETFVTADFGLLTLRDILQELENPGRDPRQNFELFEYTDGIESIKDLQADMVLNGVVTNVTRFGAFVDIGVHQDGLVHVSQLSHHFVTNPEQVISVGEKVKVKVLSIDLDLKRIQLSIKALQTKTPTKKPNSSRRVEKRTP